MTRLRTGSWHYRVHHLRADLARVRDADATQRRANVGLHPPLPRTYSRIVLRDAGLNPNLQLPPRVDHGPDQCAG